MLSRSCLGCDIAWLADSVLVLLDPTVPQFVFVSFPNGSTRSVDLETPLIRSWKRDYAEMMSESLPEGAMARKAWFGQVLALSDGRIAALAFPPNPAETGSELWIKDPDGPEIERRGCTGDFVTMPVITDALYGVEQRSGAVPRYETGLPAILARRDFRE